MGSVEGASSVAMAEREVDDVARVTSKEGYRAEAIAKALATPANLTPKKSAQVVPG